MCLLPQIAWGDAAAPPAAADDRATGEPVHVSARLFRAHPRFRQVDIVRPAILDPERSVIADVNGDGRSEVLTIIPGRDVAFIDRLDPDAPPVLEDRWPIDRKTGVSPTFPRSRTLVAIDADGDDADDLAFAAEDGRVILLSSRPADRRFEEKAIFRAKTDPIVALVPLEGRSASLRGLAIFFTVESEAGALTTLRFGEHGQVLSRAAATAVSRGTAFGAVSFAEDELPVPAYEVRTVTTLTTLPRYVTAAAGAVVADFPASYAWRGSVAGDFNGDGYDDIVALGSGLQGSWIALGLRANGRTMFVEEPLNDRFEPLTEAHAADVNGDGLTDLVTFDAVRMKLLLSDPGPPYANATLSVGGRTVTLDADGRGGMSETDLRSPAGVATTDPLLRVIRAGRQRGGSFTIRVGKTSDVVPGASVPYPGHTVEGPFICLGYAPAGTIKKWGRASDECPPGYAMLEADDSRSMTWGLCCRLPDDGVLSGAAEYIDGPMCPDGFIVTGVSLRASASPDGSLARRELLRCSAVQSDRYRLGPPRPGVYWGAGLSSDGNQPGISPRELPAGIRHAVGRIDYDRWDIDGCLGQPPGAILVSRGSNRCEEVIFRELLRAGPSPGSAEEAVQMFPRCREVRDLYNPFAGCRSASGADD